LQSFDQAKVMAVVIIMEIEETVEVGRSEENGNIPLDTPSDSVSNTPAGETPEETPEETPAEGEPEVPADSPADPPEDELFELPDGRKVDAATLQTEWKENFAPEYTRKSQELAALKNENLPEAPPSPYADPDYVPESYEEILKVAEQRALEAIEAKETQRNEQQKAAEAEVVAQLDAVKKIDPSVDENKLFLHANKYGFRDLNQAHQNMRDMSAVAKTVQKNTVKNIAKRNDPVSISPGGTGGAAPDPSMFESATDYLRSLNN